MSMEIAVANDANKAFAQSAVLCTMRNSLKEKILDLEKKLAVTFKTESEFINDEVSMPDWKLGIYMGIVFAIAFSLNLILHTRGDSTLFVVTLLSFVLGAFAYSGIRKAYRNMQVKKASQSYVTYHQSEVEYNRKKENWQIEADEYSEKLQEVEKTLRQLRRVGGIHDEYWDDGYILWHYVETGRAESLREATNLYETDKKHYEMLSSMKDISHAQQTLYYQNLKLQRSQEAMRSRMESLALQNEINNDLNTALTILALRNE